LLAVETFIYSLARVIAIVEIQSRGERLVGDVIEKDFNTAIAAGADR
jgi:hypothetical protein